MTTKSEKQIALLKKIHGLETDLSETLSKLVSAKLELRLLQEFELEPPVPRRRAAVTAMTKREMVARVLRDQLPEGLSLKEIREALIHSYSEDIERATLSTMLNRLKHGGYIFRSNIGIWHWNNNAPSASTSLKG